MGISFKNLVLGIKDQLPLGRMFRNFIITGNGWGLFHKHSHIRQDSGNPKQIYKTKKIALKSAKHMSKVTGKYFSTYKCVFCDGYHIGRNRDNR
jgi:hypothetical protein